VVQALLEQGDAPDQTDPQGRTALMLAAARGDTALVQRLLAAGADANRRDARGRTAADHARLAGHEALARHLTPSPGAGER
jgi:ankyrin repeat protein